MKQVKLWVFAAILITCGGSVLTSCSKDDDSSVVQPTSKEYFTLWNQCEALTALQEYVKDVTDPASKNFIREEDRIATFDMDGTFVGELYPTYFEYNLLEYRVLDDPTYKDIAPRGREGCCAGYQRLCQERQETARPFRYGACLCSGEGL